MLGADYSEHSASRFRGGLVGWMAREGNLDSWSKAVAAIAFWSVPMTTRPAQKPKYAQNLLSVNIFELGP